MITVPPEQLGEQVESEFRALLDLTFPKDKVEDPAVHERQKLQAFLDDKSDNYIPNKAYISYLDKIFKRYNQPASGDYRRKRYG